VMRLLVTGASGFIGRNVLLGAPRDWEIVAVAHRTPDLDAFVEQQRLANVRVVRCDLTDAAAVRDLFARLGAFDHLVFTAGETLQLASLADTDLDAARRFFGLRYWGAFTAAKYGSGSIRPGGSIVFTSGSAGARPHAGWSIASSICSAMEGLTRALAVELAPVRVNIVSPGVVKTPLWREMTSAARDALYAAEAQRLLVGHVGESQEIADGYIYLMRQTYVTGQTLAIDGGGLLV